MVRSRENYLRICKKCGKVSKLQYIPHEDIWCLNCSNKYIIRGAAGLKGCLSPVWKGGKTKRICKNCKNIFFRYLPKSPQDRNYGIFCSQVCRNIWNNKYIVKKKDTLIEQLIEKELRILNIRFDKQYPIKNITLADFYIPEQRIVIYCDGDYWHSLPNVKMRDSKTNKLLINSGFRVIRLKEKDIEQNPKESLFRGFKQVDK